MLSFWIFFFSQVLLYILSIQYELNSNWSRIYVTVYLSDNNFFCNLNFGCGHTDEILGIMYSNGLNGLIRSDPLVHGSDRIGFQQ